MLPDAKPLKIFEQGHGIIVFASVQAWHGGERWIERLYRFEEGRLIGRLWQ